MNSTPIKRYLEQYAEAEAQRVSRFDLPYVLNADRALILPIYDEPWFQLENFLTPPAGDGLLSVWVFNAPDGGDIEARKRTQQALQQTIDRLHAVQISEGFYLGQDMSQRPIVLIDRCADLRLIPSRQGVGLARKIGADVALALSQSELKWLFFCDADVELPKNYFAAFNERETQSASAYVLPFEHVCDSGLELETALYDFRLNYFQKQLELARSPYAYHALGSIIVADSQEYAHVRGVPKRAAGEDFYLLNKLQKRQGVITLESPLIKIRARHSMRVPFGTGPALSALSGLENPLKEYRYYHPQSFKALAYLIDLLNNVAQRGGSSTELEKQLKQNQRLYSVLKELRLDRFITHANQQKLTQFELVRSFHEWFDALATLRFIHIMRDRCYEDISILALADMAEGLSNSLKSQIDTILLLGSHYID